jgi:lipoprotein-releasing system permease protein
LPVEFFISNRLIRNNSQGTKVSKPITRISVISISLAIVVNLITLAIVTGFQNEIREKIMGFSAPLFISKMGTDGFYDCDPIHKNQTDINAWKNVKGVKNINPVCYKPALLQSARFSDTLSLISGKDSVAEKQEIEGVIMKGVDLNYDWSFLKKHLKLGRLPKFNRNSSQQEILVSSKIALNLNYKINDQISVYYVKDHPIVKHYKVVGIFNTGLEEFDKRIVFCDIREIQRMGDFGISSKITIDDTISKSGSILLKAEISGNLKDLLFDWGYGPEIYGGIYLNQLRDTTIRLVVHQIDYARNQSTPLDTSYIRFYCNQKRFNSSDFTHDEHFKLKREDLSENSFILLSNKDEIRVESIPGKGTSYDYVSGFEVQLHNWDKLKPAGEALKSIIEMKQTKYNELLHIQDILNAESDLFAWLAFLDYNVLIIIILMLVIGIVNVGSAMLVLIVVRTNFIGILKAIGATDWNIRKIFLIHAANLILKGMLIGNVVGLTICFIQYEFGVFSLDPSIYYLDKVPIELTILNWLLINLITFFVCLISLIIPSYVVTRISPTKSIRFN